MIVKQLNKLMSATEPATRSLLNKLLVVQVRNASAFKFVPETAPSNLGETTKMNLCQSITNALDLTLSTDKSAG